jgi:hypothetical protein
VKDPTNPPSGYHVYTDRYYTSPQLADELLGMNMVTTGTVMPFRKQMPETLKMNKVGKTRQTDVLSFRKNDKIVPAWRNKCTVMIFSTFHSEIKNKVTEMPSRYPNKLPIKPNVLLDYTKRMGGVNWGDYHVAMLQLLCCFLPVYMEDKEVVQNILLFSGSKYSKFILTLCLVSGTIQ